MKINEKLAIGSYFKDKNNAEIIIAHKKDNAKTNILWEIMVKQINPKKPQIILNNDFFDGIGIRRLE